VPSSTAGASSATGTSAAAGIPASGAVGSAVAAASVISAVRISPISATSVVTATDHHVGANIGRGIVGIVIGIDIDTRTIHRRPDSDLKAEPKPRSGVV